MSVRFGDGLVGRDGELALTVGLVRDLCAGHAATRIVEGESFDSRRHPRSI